MHLHPDIFVDVFVKAQTYCECNQAHSSKIFCNVDTTESCGCDGKNTYPRGLL
jgi:hypothetical protein